MAEHLLKLGHRKVGFISPPLTRRQQQRFQRVEGFIQKFREEGLEDGVIVKAADEEVGQPYPQYGFRISDRLYPVQGTASGKSGYDCHRRAE